MNDYRVAQKSWDNLVILFLDGILLLQILSYKKLFDSTQNLSDIFYNLITNL